MASVTDPHTASNSSGNTTTWTYDDQNRVTSISRKCGDTTLGTSGFAYASPSCGNLTQYTDADGRVTTYQYLCLCQLAVVDLSEFSITRPAKLTQPLRWAVVSRSLCYRRSQGTSRCSFTHKLDGCLIQRLPRGGRPQVELVARGATAEAAVSVPRQVRGERAASAALRGVQGARAAAPGRRGGPRRQRPAVSRRPQGQRQRVAHDSQWLP